jgi:hypothetical protein
MYRRFFVLRIFPAFFLLSLLTGGISSAVPSEKIDSNQGSFSENFEIKRIAEPAKIPPPPSSKIDLKRSCPFQYDNGTVFSFFPNWGVGDKVAIYFDPQTCGVPHPYPFQIKEVEFLLYNHAGVDSTQLKFSIWTVGSNLCSGPQTQIYSSPLYTVTAFYPDWTSISFGDNVCLSSRFFFVVEYSSGEYGSIPSLVSDSQQEMVDSCYQWLWHNPYSPPWKEWNNYWNEPDPGWLMLRLVGETYSLTCDSGWLWLGDNGYAPSGAPDVSADQGGWVGRSGPVAMVNCLGWFGLNSSWGWNVPEFVDTLSRYFQTDSAGTEPHLMKAGIDNLLNDLNIPSIYTGIWSAPDFYEMQDSLRVSQTIALLLGFWWWDGANWWREGGQFVTLAGEKSSSLKIALCDPSRDQAEYGWPGRVRSPDHPPAPHADTLHNDFLYVSQDIYQSQLSSSPPGNPYWQLNDYLELNPDFPRQFTGTNIPTEFISYTQAAPAGTSFITAVEYAVMICSRQEHWWWKASFPDYAPSGMPDFDQKQDHWLNPITSQMSFSGPVAVANSFWWLDSKFNLPPGNMGDGMDQYPLVRDYLDDLTPYLNWDDHDLANVDQSVTPWPSSNPPPATPQPFIPGPQTPGGTDSWGELVERLAWYLDTDGQRSGNPHVGTNVQGMTDAIREWFSSETFDDGSSLNDSLCVMSWERPTFAFVESLVEQNNNVILLLGFWYQENSDWRRVGGHFVTVAGVNSVQLMIAFSDPYFDNAETGGAGRVLSGSYISHSPIPHSDSTLHNDPGNVSHDIYNVSLDYSNPAGRWWVSDYPVDVNPDSLSSIFYQQNVPNEFVSVTQPYISGYALCTVAEYALLIDTIAYRGDASINGIVDSGDIVFLINYLYRGGSAPHPLSTGDVTCDGVVDVADAIFLINYLFRQGPTSHCCGP